MAVNDVVKWKLVTSEEEANERFIVLEVNDDRCLIEAICSLPIRPTMVGLVWDFVQA